MSLPKVLGAIAVLACSYPAFSIDINVPNDYATIQGAIDASVSGDAILVDSGTYSEIIDFLGKDITVTGVNGASNTIIDGSSTTGSVVSFITGEAATVVLDGFTIQGGVAANGPGVIIIASFPTIRNCLVTGNQSTSNGGAIFVDAGRIQLENVVIEANISANAGGALYMRDSGGSITGGSMLNNLAVNGGAIYVKSGASELALSGVTIQGNSVSASGGGVFATNSQLTASNCTFDLNSSNRGGGWFSWSSGNATISDCFFTGNSAADLGGAADIRSSTVSFIRCTFDSNIADSDCDTVGGGGLLDNTNGIVTLEDPTICNNLLCDVESNYSGDDPIFVGDIFDCSLSGTGACCGGDACWEMSSVDCSNGGGAWNGDGTLCVDVTCVGGGGETTGACCVGADCVQATETSCVDAGGVFYGSSVTCIATNCPAGCAEDINGDGFVNVNDLLALIGAWGMCP